MSSFLIAFVLSAPVISALTGLIKRLPLFTSLSDSTRTPAVRALAGLISFVYIILGMYLTNSVSPDVTSNALQALMLAIVPWLGSLGIFHAFFQSKVVQQATLAPTTAALATFAAAPVGAAPAANAIAPAVQRAGDSRG